jgi:hypothetical protein
MAPPRTSDPTALQTRAAKRAAYFRTYYEAHRADILEKNRRWAREHRQQLSALRKRRRERLLAAPEEPRRCLDCGRVVARALRCRTCYERWRYAHDPAYRTRRLATTRRWLERRAEG